MPRMLDLIRNSQVPFNLMHSAAHGSLAVQPGETIEILVYLAIHHKLFGEQARMTLAGWDEKASLAAAADPNTSAEVLGYFISAENLRPVLLPALAENPSVSVEALDVIAVSGSRSTLEILLMSTRVMNSPQLLQALHSNDKLRPKEVADIEKRLAGMGVRPIPQPAMRDADTGSGHTGSEVSPSALPPAPEVEASEDVLEGTVAQYLLENAAEVEAEKDRPFQPIGMAQDLEGGAPGEVGAQAESGRSGAAAPSDEAGSGHHITITADAAIATTEAAAPVATKPTPVVAGKSAAAAAAASHARKQNPAGHEERRDSTLQKIARLDIRGRIALAVRGSKEDRSILIRDSTKLVALAVLESPKVSDAEVESFALQKNVMDSVLRAIPLKRKFAKNYGIMRNLVYNPRTPIDTSLPLMKGLLVHDLKNLAGNKEVSDTIRKSATRLYKQRMEKKN
jgi:hypothetical protein